MSSSGAVAIDAIDESSKNIKCLYELFFFSLYFLHNSITTFLCDPFFLPSYEIAEDQISNSNFVIHCIKIAVQTFVMRKKISKRDKIKIIA